MKERRNMLKIVAAVSGGLAALGIAANILLVVGFVRSAPRSPQPETGNIVPFNDHGTYIYITHLQHILSSWALIAGLLALVVAVVGMALLRQRSGSE